MIDHPLVQLVRDVSPVRHVGFVVAATSGSVVSIGPACRVGDLCRISIDREADRFVLAEVSSVDSGRVILSPLEALGQPAPQARVELMSVEGGIPVGDRFAGRAISALGYPLDDRGAIFSDGRWPTEGRLLAPLERDEYSAQCQTGIRAIDALLPLGRGQRLGIFAASGVGKTSLIRQIAFQTRTDRCVVCLVGERGKEVEAFWRAAAALPDAARFSIVAATSDASPVLRARCVAQALALSEFWRDRGEHVLLILDSATRYAMALREIGLSAGEPPTLRAYTPNVFAALPRVVERCGARRGGGAITAIMTILSETDDVDDPIVEVMKSLLDGHIILSRQLAEQGRFPAIDVPRSVSRLSERLMTQQQHACAKRAAAQLAAFEDARILIESGLYKTGGNAEIDSAMRNRDALAGFLGQPQDMETPMAESFRRLAAIMSAGGQT